MASDQPRSGAPREERGGSSSGGPRGGGGGQSGLGRGGKPAGGKQGGGVKPAGGKQGGGVKPAGGKQGGGVKPGGGKQGGGGRPRPDAHRRDGRDETAKQLAGPLQQVLRRLPETQRKVLEYRMGLVDGHPHDLADTARALGLSMSEARDIEKRAFEHIRETVPLQQLQRFLDR
jgi:hypothetical protein